MSDPGIVHVVDDDDSYRTALCRLLRIMGFPVRAFSSGEQLLATVVPETAGCVLADLRMPGLNGFELHAALRRAGVMMPLIILTGEADPADLESSFGRDRVEFLEKRTAKEPLLAAIGRALVRDSTEEWERAHPAHPRPDSAAPMEQGTPAGSLAGIPGLLATNFRLGPTAGNGQPLG